MKAWLARERDEFCATVVFAETRGKARSLAMHTEACEDASFVDIEVYRKPDLDKYYVDGREQRIWRMPPGPELAKERSKTYEGIAKAMANTWG